jgi:hypothetical protein
VPAQAWDAAGDERSVRLEFSLGRDGDRFGPLLGAHGLRSLHAAPGAVVVAGPGAREVVGLQ